jgi:hypothetical protein
LNIFAVNRYNPTTNHILDNKNLNETTGMVLVSDVKKIHKRFKYIASETGCVRISLSNPLSCNTFNKKIMSSPKRNGSVGKYMSKLNPGAIS